MFVAAFPPVDAQHPGPPQPTGAIHSDRRLRQWTGPAHANVLWARLCTVGQFHAGNQSAPAGGHAITGVLEVKGEFDLINVFM